MAPTTEIINRVLPVLFLLALGQWIRRRRSLAETTIEELRKLVVTLALPAVLFPSFLSIHFEASYLTLVVGLFLLCVALYGLGLLLRRLLRIPHPYFPFLMTGFEYGMMGISLFAGAYGLDHIGVLVITDLGHELFIWSFFLVLLLLQRDGRQEPREVLGAFVRSPVVIAIIAGLAGNALGLGSVLPNLPVTGALLETLRLLGQLVIPLILIIVGYGMQIERAGAWEAGSVVLLRLLIMVPLALLVNSLVIRGLLSLAPAFEVAVFTLLILPPPFIVPLYARPDLPHEQRYINNVLTLHTIASIAVFIALFVSHPRL